MTNITILDLSYNFLSGCIMPISNLSNLQELYLEYNNLEGEIPDNFFHQSVIGISLYNNLFSGTLDWMKGLTALELVDISFNSFEGR